MDVGRFKTRLITTASVNNKPTGCKDTMYLDLVVTGSKPFRNLVITPDTMDLSTNNFSYSLSDTLVTGLVWQFGDGDTSHRKVTTHTYKDSGTYKVTVTATMLNGKSATTTKKLRVNYDTVDSTTGITSPSIQFIQTYPNPTQDVINIQFEQLNNYTIEIQDALGRVVWCVEQNNLTETINVSQWTSGNYSITVKQGNSRILSRSIQIRH
jgi:PKD repeat protein